MSPPPISGSAGMIWLIRAKRLKKLSSGPNTMLGRRIVTSGNAARAAASPAALVRA